MQGKTPFSPIQDRGLGVLVWTEKALHASGHPEHKGKNGERAGRQEHSAGGDEELLAPGYISTLSYKDPTASFSFDWFIE